jgi:hypothetical protein
MIEFDDVKIEQGREAGSVNQPLLIDMVEAWLMFWIMPCSSKGPLKMHCPDKGW